MEDRVKELMERIRESASMAADTAVDAALLAGRKAGQIVDVAKLNVQLFDLNGELDGVMKELGRVMYDAHLGRSGEDDRIPQLLKKADELSLNMTELKGRIAALRQSRTCPNCGAACGTEDHFCRSCGSQL